MNVRKRSGDMSTGAMGPGSGGIKNAASKRTDGPTQVKAIKNAVTTPAAVKPKAVKNSVSGPRS